MSCADCDVCTVDVPEPEVAADSCRHELHVTVHPSGPLSRFRDVCNSLSIRPLCMAIRKLDGSLHTEWMTGSSYEGSDAGAMRALAEVGDDLASAGYDPIRAKIEAAPWHPRAVLGDFGQGLPGDTYWESHLGLWLRNDQVDVVHRTVWLANGYLSRNQLKPGRGVGYHQQNRWSVTLRSHFLGRENQAVQAEYIAGVLRDAGADVDAGIRHEWTWTDYCLDPDMPGGPPGGRPS